MKVRVKVWHDIDIDLQKLADSGYINPFTDEADVDTDDVEDAVHDLLATGVMEISADTPTATIEVEAL